jgi:hypothetical protein
MIGSRELNSNCTIAYTHWNLPIDWIFGMGHDNGVIRENHKKPLSFYVYFYHSEIILVCSFQREA